MIRPFDYFSPRTTSEVCRIITEHQAEARIVAGGTDVLVELRRRSAKSPNIVVDISHVASLKGISERNNEIVIGPLTTHTEIADSPIIRSSALLLRQAALSIGSPQIRNRGTIGGNIMNAAACADLVPPLIALNASIRLTSSSATRTVRLDEFFLAPYQTIARTDELVEEIRFTRLSGEERSAYVKLGRRNALSIARMSVAVILRFDATHRIVEARIVPGAAFPTWMRVSEAEQLLISQQPSDDLFTNAGKKVSEVMISITGRRWSTEYKEPVVAVMVRRALEACLREVKS